MTGRRLLPALALTLATLLPAASAAKPGLTIAFIAYENPNQLLTNVEPVIDYLEGRLGIEVAYFAATDYAAVVEALRGGSADVGFMGPLQAVISHRETGARPILGELYNGSPTYVSRIFVRKDSGLAELADLEGRTMAFTDPLSSSGYLYPLDAFRRAGLIATAADADRFFKRVYFAGGDEQAIRAVFNRFVDAAGIGQYAFDLLRPEERAQLTSIGESQPIPSHCVVVRDGLDEKLVERLRSALLALNDGPHHGLLQNLYSVDGYVAVSAETYSEVDARAVAFGILPPAKR